MNAIEYTIIHWTWWNGGYIDFVSRNWKKSEDVYYTMSTRYIMYKFPLKREKRAKNYEK